MSREAKLHDLARSITEEVTGGAHFDVGDTVEHPSGRTVKITGGSWWGTYGLSNHWII